MGYAVLHLDKASGNEAKMTAHIERTQMPKNADPERTHLNQELVSFPDGVNNRTEAIQHRLDNAGLKRKVGTNQVRAIRFMLTGSHEDMKRIEAEGRLDEWCNDNLDWVRNTFGADNLVSAVIHLDESTPHIHATVIPIVTGERRKAKEQKAGPGKKQYSKKDPNSARLCADDVMTSTKLKEYQDTYAEMMEKYGLRRGIVGSEARHITTREFYRNAIAQQESIQENIELLLQTEEFKRQSVENLKQKESKALIDCKQADDLKQQKESELEQAETELKEVKGQLKTEKFKSSAAEAGSALMDGISSAFGTSKVKRRQQVIESLKYEKHELQQDIEGLTQTINRERSERQQETMQLKAEIRKIHDWLPDTPTLIKWGEYCQKIGFSNTQARDLINMKPVRFSGELYSSEHSQRFTVNDAELRFDLGREKPSGFRLLINGSSLTQWFRQKYDEFRETLGIKPKQQPEMGKKGIKM